LDTEKKMSRKLALLILSLGAAATAQAHDGRPGERNSPPRSHDTPTVSAPEIDPASAMSAFTLLAGGLVMIRGRRASKTK
jgi:hypothetical protein